MKVNRLQLPLPNSHSDSAGNIIPENEHNVNSNLRGKSNKQYAMNISDSSYLDAVRLGNMAVVVNLRNNQYKVHRIVMPNGSVFKFDVTKNNAEQESQRGVPKGSLANATSSAPINSITQSEQKSNSSDKKTSEKYSEKQYALDIDNFYANGEEFATPTISTVGKERVSYEEKVFGKEWRKTKAESAYIHVVAEDKIFLEKVEITVEKTKTL